MPHSAIRNPHSRRGVTLIEVLIAMFVMAIGLMGILALFPAGALQMANAVKNERTNQTATIMEGHAKYLWREAWTDPQGLKPEVNVLSSYTELAALDNPSVQPSQVGAYLTGALPGTNYQGDRLSGAPSSPVFIDPIGHATQTAGTAQYWVGYPYQVLPRRTLSIPPTFTNGAVLPTVVRIRLCGLLDDLTFDINGLPPVNFVQRAGDYNAAWLIQRPKNNLRTEVNLQVVVYRKRPPADTYVSETPIGNYDNLNPIYPGSRQLTLPLGVPAPKAGTWLLLAGTQSNTQEAYADFYRVVSVAGTGPFTVEFNQPLKSHAVNYGPYTGVLIQMENVAEVFDKGTLSIDERPTQ